MQSSSSALDNNSTGGDVNEKIQELEKKLKEREQQFHLLQEKSKKSEEILETKVEELKKENEIQSRKLQDLSQQTDQETNKEILPDHFTLQNLKKVMKKLVVKNAESEYQLRRLQVWENSSRLGKMIMKHGVIEYWEEGFAFTDIEMKRKQLLNKRERLEQKRKELTKYKTSLKPKLIQLNITNSSSSSTAITTTTTNVAIDINKNTTNPVLHPRHSQEKINNTFPADENLNDISQNDSNNNSFEAQTGKDNSNHQDDNMDLDNNNSNEKTQSQPAPDVGSNGSNEFSLINSTDAQSSSSTNENADSYPLMETTSQESKYSQTHSHSNPHSFTSNKKYLHKTTNHCNNSTITSSSSSFMQAATTGTQPTSHYHESIQKEYDQLVLSEEVLKHHINNIKREENELMQQYQRLLIERNLHKKQSKLVYDQEKSCLNLHYVLKDRYVLGNLLGCGGFSEVYSAFDLLEHKNVACKIHQLDSHWSQRKKESYQKHAIREHIIQKSICHDRVVRLFDVFSLKESNELLKNIPSTSFCTILEYCNDGDLDSRLKIRNKLPEKEVRCIIAQILEGLRYLNRLNNPIIHYDLKPGNILFHNGEVKITDFGLSKIVENSDDGMVDLTSQGAGTYGYLPPECKMYNKETKISSKVCILFNLLFLKTNF